MTFDHFQAINALRCREAFGHGPGADNWPLQNWALAIAGEAGELCNLVKKCLRGDFTIDSQRDEILAELADIITYADLAITHLNANTGAALAEKFDHVSDRRGWRGERLAGAEHARP